MVPTFRLTSDFRCGVICVHYHWPHRTIAPVRDYPRQSRQAIILRLAALFRVKPVRKDVEQKSRTEPATGLHRGIRRDLALGIACIGWRHHRRMGDRGRLGRRRARSMACWLEELACFHRGANDHAPPGEVDFKCNQHLRFSVSSDFTRRSLPADLSQLKFWALLYGLFRNNRA